MKTETVTKPCLKCGEDMTVKTRNVGYDYEIEENCSSCGHSASYTQYRDDTEGA